MSKKEKPHPRLEDLPVDVVEQMLKDYPMTTMDIVDFTLEECKKKGITPNVEILHLVLEDWLSKDSKRSELAGNFRLVDKQITIRSSTISMWYAKHHGKSFKVFAESDTSYYALVSFEDGEKVVRTVDKVHVE